MTLWGWWVGYCKEIVSVHVRLSLNWKLNPMVNLCVFSFPYSCVSNNALHSNILKDSPSFIFPQDLRSMHTAPRFHGFYILFLLPVPKYFPFASKTHSYLDKYFPINNKETQCMVLSTSFKPRDFTLHFLFF